eukprot:gene103-142_t
MSKTVKALLTACALAATAGAALAQEQVVNLYSARHYSTDEALYTGFTKATGIKINRVDADDAGILARLKAEGTASPADVILLVDAARLYKGEVDGLFQPIQSKLLNDAIPANLRSAPAADGGISWFGLSTRARFVKGNRESVRKMLVGLGSLSRGELAGERLEVALNSQDQEDEHSCFSDNTHRDAVTNAKGIQNVWLGQYQQADGTVLMGPSLRDLVAAKDAALAEKTTQQIAASVAAAEGIQAPFDREIIGGKEAPGRQRIQKTIDSLTQQSKDLVAAANAIGITKLTLVQP